MRDRVLTWLICGPLGHFVGGFLDWLELLGRYAWWKAQPPSKRRRLPSA